MLLIAALISLLFSCDEEESDSSVQMKKVLISEAISNSGEYALNVYAKDTLYEGYNKLYLELKETNSGNEINEAKIELFPLMHMILKTHAAPVENPDELIGESGFFEGAIVFIMPSNPDENWTIDVTLRIGEIDDTVQVSLPVVKSLDDPRKINVISDIDETVYFVSWIEPDAPKVGVNDLEFSVHYKQNMMSFPAVEDLSIEIEPEMPSMDHGSPNNVNPVHVVNGHYEGKVNFTMTGWWRIHVTVKKGNEIVTDDAYFDVTF